MGVFKTRQFSGPTPRNSDSKGMAMGGGSAVERLLKTDILKGVIGHSYVGGL